MSTIRHVQREIWINASPETVWRALTVPEERNKWETRRCKIDLVPGGIIQLDYGWGVSYEGIFTEIEYPHRIVSKDADKDLTIWTIEEQDGGCHVTIEYTGLWSGELGLMQMDNMLFGTYQFMRNMKSVLENANDQRAAYWRSWIGMNHRTIAYQDTSAVKVVQVITNTPAFSSLQEGDVITAINEIPVHHYEDLERVITEMAPYMDIRLQIYREGQPYLLMMQTIPYGSKLGSIS